MTAESGSHVQPGQAGFRAGRLQRLGEWCARHFVIVIVAWLVALAALQVLQPLVRRDYSDDFSLPGSPVAAGPGRAEESTTRAAGGYSSQIVLHDTSSR